MELANALYIVINASLGKVFCSLRKRHIVLFALLWTLIKYSPKLWLESRSTPRRFRDVVWLTVLLLKIRGKWFTFLVFPLKIISWACLLRSGLKLKKSCKSLSRFPDVSFCSNLNMTPSCQTFPNAFKISRKTHLTTVKRFVNIMSYRRKLIYTGIFRFKTRLISRK